MANSERDSTEKKKEKSALNGPNLLLELLYFSSYLQTFQSDGKSISCFGDEGNKTLKNSISLLFTRVLGFSMKREISGILHLQKPPIKRN